jgi:intein/homing endonuclease
MCDDLRKLGFHEKKTKSLAIPNIPKKYFPDFVRGYFDGDGNVWVGKVYKERKKESNVLKVIFTSCSYEFIKELQKELFSFGLRGGCLYRPKEENFCRLQFSTINALKLYDFMYNGINKGFSDLFLNRKKKIFENFKNLRS